MLHPLASLWRHPSRVWFYESGRLAGQDAFDDGGLDRLDPIGVRRRFASVDEAFAYLRYWAAEPAVRAELRFILNRSGPALASAHAGEAGWLRALAARMAAGAVVVIEENRGNAAPGRLVAPASAAPAADAVADLPPLSTVAAVVAAPVAEAVAAEPEAVPTPAEPESEPAPQPLAPEAVAAQVAQAQTLEQAARDGTPFCEICEAAAASAEPPAPPAPPEQPEPPAALADQLAQAETLEQAARQGTPFCEICEAQAAGRAQGSP